MQNFFFVAPKVTLLLLFLAHQWRISAKFFAMMFARIANMATFAENNINLTKRIQHE
jgi:hypothetical protein